MHPFSSSGPSAKFSGFEAKESAAIKPFEQDMTTPGHGCSGRAHCTIIHTKGTPRNLPASEQNTERMLL